MLSHWEFNAPTPTAAAHLWRNLGDGTFLPVADAEAGFDTYQEADFTFTPNFADINGDGWPDLLMAGDFESSKVFVNRGDGTFENITTEVISDENGMGGAVADYDLDGDLDWFVTSIWDPNGIAEGTWGITGNRLYRNLGDGTFEDATGEAGVREGYWGWGYGFPHAGAAEFNFDPSRLFMGQGDGTFIERSAEWGLEDLDQGRGVVCFDYDRDGDIDLFVANNSAAPRLLRNDGDRGSGQVGNFLNLRLRGDRGRIHSPWERKSTSR